MRNKKNIICFVCVCLTIITALTIILYYYFVFGYCTIVVTNKETAVIRRLVILWPDGNVDCVKNLPCGMTTQLNYKPRGEGSIDIFYLLVEQRKWYHLEHIGYVCPNINTKINVVLQLSDNFEFPSQKQNSSQILYDSDQSFQKK
jgi:hypothetical protein